MAPRTLEQLLAYLANLGQRHQDVKTVRVGLAGAFPDLSAEEHPAVFIEADPLMEQLNELQDKYTVAIHFLTKEERTDETRGPALVSQMKQLADEYGQQLLREQHVEIISQPTAVSLLEAGTALASGVRWEIGLLVPKVLDRSTNPDKFTKMVSFPYTLPITLLHATS